MDVGRYIQTVAGVGGDPFAGISGRDRHLLATPPITKELLELSARGPGFSLPGRGRPRG